MEGCNSDCVVGDGWDEGKGQGMGRGRGRGRGRGLIYVIPLNFTEIR